MKEYRTYKELDVWVKSRALVKEIYLLTQNFPKEELYGLVSQMRRCAVSVVSNIAEGYGRQYKRETIHFFHTARGSLFELEAQLLVAYDLGYVNRKLEELLFQIELCKKLLNGLINYFENNPTLK